MYLSALKVRSAEAVVIGRQQKNAQQNDDARECGCEPLDLSEGQMFFSGSRGETDP